MKELIMPAADDFHIHLRNDDRTPHAIRAVPEGGAARVMAMPNTLPAIATGMDAERYKAELEAQGADFEILTTIKLTPDTTPAMIEEAAVRGVTAVKQYPLGVTTNAEDGVTDVRALYPVYEAIQDCDLVLSLHGEVPGVFVMDAETAFLSSLREIHQQFPRLRIVLEHITTAASVELVRALPEQVAATITDHHLAITLSDVVGSRIQPHHFCMPVAKRPEDRASLVTIVKEGHPSFFSGTDSAPHMVEDKESACGCAGIFNSPYHMQFLASFFAQQDMLERLRDFRTLFGRTFYRMPPNKREIALTPEPFQVPDRYGPIVPFRAGTTLEFQLHWV